MNGCFALNRRIKAVGIGWPENVMFVVGRKLAPYERNSRSIICVVKFSKRDPTIVLLNY